MITTCGHLMIFRIIPSQISTNTSKSHIHFYQLEWRFPISQSPNTAQLFLFYSALLNTIGHNLQKSLSVHHSVSRSLLQQNLVPVLQGLGQRCWQCHLPPHSFLTPTPHVLISYPGNSRFHSQRWVSAKGTRCWGFINISWSSVSCKHIFLAQHQPHGTCRSLPLEGWAVISIALRAQPHKTQRITLNTSSP